MSDLDIMSIAYVAGAHGISGDVRIKSFSEAGIDSYKTLYDESGKPYHIERCRFSNKHLIIKFKEITNRNEAEAAKGLNLFIKKSQLPTLEDDEYYYDDLVGLEVITSTKEVIASVIAMYNFGAGEIVELKFLDGKVEMLPFTKIYFPLVNLKEKFIMIDETLITE